MSMQKRWELLLLLRKILVVVYQIADEPEITVPNDSMVVKRSTTLLMKPRTYSTTTTSAERKID